MNIFPFGSTADGRNVECIRLDNGTLSCEIITFGATVRSLTVSDREGEPVDVVLGYDTLDEYLSHDGYLGATVGRFANRIAKGRFCLNGQTYNLAVNNGENHLHGGLQGFSHRVWDIAHRDSTSVTLTLTSPHMEEGYPGTLQCSVRFSLEENALVIRYQAVSDRDTPCSLTNHSYFNLAGQGSALGHRLKLHAAYYTPSDEGSIPYGRLDPVEGTPMDFREPKAIGKEIGEPFPQLLFARGYDHNFAIDGQPGTLRPGAVAYCEDTGITMEMLTTLPGVHFYSANYMPEGRPGKGGLVYAPRYGFCLETQFFPDSPNRPGFLSPVLRAGEAYDHTTVFRFTS